MQSPNDSSRIQQVATIRKALSSTGSIDIDDNAIDDAPTPTEDSGELELERPGTRDSAVSDVTCLSVGCCSRFEALTGLDLHAIKRELEAATNASEDTLNSQGPQICASFPAERGHKRSVFEGGPDHKALHLLEKKAMALNRVDGPDELFVGGIFALRRPGAMESIGITHILSMIKYSFVDSQGFGDRYIHMSVDIDDVDDEDIIVHLPRAVQFVQRGLNGGTGEYPGGTVLPTPRSGEKAEAEEAEAGTKADGQASPRRTSLPESEMRNLTLKDDAKADPNKPGAVFVHCAMGKSRSVTAVVAYLLWRHPHRYGLTPGNVQRPDEETARNAVQAAVDWVRKTREIAEPNPGFMKQLEMWVMMGRPADADDAVERHPTYQRWIWEREVKESANIGKKPDWLRFEDETENQDNAGRDGETEQGKELRCKKCRRVLATQQFIIPHQKEVAGKKPCPHHFIEALSWMRPVLEEGELDGRLICPNPRCGSSLGRYSWKGFKCSCNEWVCPAFSLGASKVDEVATRKPGPATTGRTGLVDGRAEHGIRMPPGRENL